MNYSGKNILIIGAGPTGSSTAYLINKFIKYFHPVSKLSIIDKGSKLGGRLSTTYDDNGNNLFDLGFRYIKYDKKNVFHKLGIFAYNDLDKFTNRIYCPIGYSDLFYKNLSDVDTKLNTKIIGIDYTKLYDKNQWKVTVQNNKTLYYDTFYYDFIISTIPVPQLIQLNGNFKNNFDSDTLQYMKQVTYDNMISLGISYEKKIKSQGWIDTQLHNNNVLDWVCLESNRNKKLDNSRIILHARSDWSEKNFIEDKRMIKKCIMNKFNELVPEFKDQPVSQTKLMRWKYAHVINNTQLFNKYRKYSLYFDKELPMVIAGDSVVGSDFNNCLNSALSSFVACQDFMLDLKI